jgi:hypothetical protein
VASAAAVAAQSALSLSKQIKKALKSTEVPAGEHHQWQRPARKIIDL